MRLFDYISSSPMSIEELIRYTKYYPAAVRAWCIAAQSYRFIGTRRGKLHLKNQMKHMLIDKSSKDYLGGQFSYLALRSLEYNKFEKLFKFGRTTKMSNSLNAVQQATDWDHYAFLAKARDHKKLYGLLSKGCWLLDVGCGTGSMISKLQKEYPNSRYVGIDPSVKAISSARKIVGAKGTTLVRGTGESMKFNEQFDIVFLCETLYATEDKHKVLANCWRALKVHGTIIIIEGLLSHSKIRDQASHLIRGMQVDFALQGKEFMGKKEIMLLLKEHNFSAIRLQDLGGNVYLVTAMKK
jgi:SAM-dependent methyltransferase